MTNAGDFVRNLYTDVNERVDRARAFRAVAQGTQSAGLITIKRLESTSNDGQPYGRLKGFATADQDNLVCVETRGGGTLVLGTLQNTAPTGYTLDAGLTLADGLTSLGGITLAGGIRFGGTAGAPTIAAQTNAGTTATITATAGGDEHGEFTLTPGGTGIAAGVQVLITFSVVFADANYDLVIVPRNANAAAVNWYSGTRAVGSVQVAAAAALSTGVAYGCSYMILGR